MERVTGWRKFTPHGIEDIIRRDTRTVVSVDCQGDSYQDRESQGDNYKYSNSQGDSFQDRDSPSPLSLSKLYKPETDRHKVGADTETQIREVENPIQIEKASRRKKVRTTFTGRQIFELEKMFETKKYLNVSERSNLSRLENMKFLSIVQKCSYSRSLSVTEHPNKDLVPEQKDKVEEEGERKK
jgi:hypothetical protein